MKTLVSTLKLFLLLSLLLCSKLTFGADYYWVGGSGKWNDYSNHWATSSGGNLFHSSPPSNIDNVWFDNNSLSNGDSIVLDTNIVQQCYNFNFNCGGGTYFIRSTGYDGNLEIWSDVTIADSLIWNDSQGFDYIDVTLQGPVVVLNAPKTIFSSLFIYSSISITMQSELTVYNDIKFYTGTPQFITNNHTLTVGYMTSDFPCNPEIRLGSSEVISGGFFDLTNIDADSAHYILDGHFQIFHPIHIHKLTVLPNLFIEVDYLGLTNVGLVVDEMYLNGEFYSESMAYDTIHTLYCYGSGYFDNLVCDTLILSKSPNWSEFAFDTLEVNHYMAVSSKPGYNISVMGNPVTQSELIVHMDTVCLDFMDLSNINAAGTAVYYAGSYSIDDGNNTGWNFSSCAPVVSGVWPGDINGNLVADNMDFIWLGQGVGTTGLTRDSISIQYISHSSTDWPSWLIGQLNMKQADCDGNGVVDTSDAAAIRQNYGLTHPAFVAPPAFSFPYTTGGAPLYFDLSQGSFTAGNTYSVPVVYGLPGGGMNQLYGIAFDISYNPSQIDPASVSLTFPNSWLGNTTNSMAIARNFPSIGKLQSAVTRFTQSDANGAGTIAILTFTLRPNATGSLQLSFNNITAVLSSGFQMPVQTIAVPVTPISVGLEESGNLNFSIYPNPATQLVYITGLPIGKNVSLTLYDGSGRLLQQSLLPSGSTSREFSIDELPPGLYYVLVNDGEHIGSRKLIII